MKHFTPSEFQKLTEDEKLLNHLLLSKKENELTQPAKQSVENILGYSKALSVRKSEKLGFIENLLN
jgi:hypothetical protein